MKRMQRPFAAYRGDAPYVFVCYAHDDAPVVYPEIHALHQQGVNVWYDEGISPGTNWRAEIGDSLENASHMLFFVSKASLASDHCNREINYALDRGQEIIPVLLDDTPLTADLRLGLSRLQMIRRADHSQTAFRDLLLETLSAAKHDEPTAHAPRSSSRSAVRTTASVAALLAIAVTGYLWLGPSKTAPPKPAVDITATNAGPKTIAVLPFVNVSADADQEYFADGISEELLNQLTRNPQLQVTSRTSAFSFKGRNADIPTVAKALNVAHVLEGSVRKSGDTVRIAAQLIEVATDSQLWSATYDRKLDDIFQIQDEIARHVAEQMNVALLGATAKQPANSGAYASYLQARYLLNTFNDPANVEKAGSLLEQALDMDPNYVPALTETARFHHRRLELGLADRDETRHLATALLDRALVIDPESAVATSFRAFNAMQYDGDRNEAARLYAKALALEPANSEVIKTAIIMALNLGRPADAIALGEFVIARDPLCAICYVNLAQAYLYAGDLARATELSRIATSLTPDGLGNNLVAAFAALYGGELNEALAEFEELLPGLPKTLGMALTLHRLGRTEEFESYFRQLREGWAEANPLMIARVYAWMDDADSAFVWLERAREKGFENFFFDFSLALDPTLLQLSNDPRWDQFLRDIGAAPEDLAQIEFVYSLPE